MLDSERHVVQTLARDRAPHLALSGGPWVGRPTLPINFDMPRFLRSEYDLWFPGVGWMTSSPLDALAVSLNYEEAKRRDLDLANLPDYGPRHVLVREPLPIEWGAEEGRLVCREAASRRVVASLGPDGMVQGDAAGERFGRLGNNPTGPVAGWATKDRERTWILFEPDLRRVVLLSLDVQRAKPQDPLEPVFPQVEVIPLVPFAGDTGGEARPWATCADRRLLVFLDDGVVIGDVALDPAETLTLLTGAILLSAAEDPTVIAPDRTLPLARVQVGAETDLGPVHPEGHRRRLRLLRPGQPLVEHEVVLEPTRASEILLANLGAAFTLLRPVPLCVASTMSAPSRDWTEVYLTWWRDPWLAAGSYPGWLVASIALAAFCGWRARRAARERCATVRQVRLWTAAVFLLGPVGLLWMRLVLPRVTVAAIGGARRAVNLDVSPSTSAPWPEPARDGIEVFG